VKTGKYKTYRYRVILDNGAVITGRIKSSSAVGAKIILAIRVTEEPDKNGQILLIGLDKSCNGIEGGWIRVKRDSIVHWAIVS
jgi:hypothetical protein